MHAFPFNDIIYSLFLDVGLFLIPKETPAKVTVTVMRRPHIGILTSNKMTLLKIEVTTNSIASVPDDHSM